MIEKDSTIDTSNKYLVSAAIMQGERRIFIQSPRVTHGMSTSDALNVAAYLVLMVGDDDQWQRTLNAIMET